MIGRAAGPAVAIAPVQIYPAWFADWIGASASTVEVSKDRVYFKLGGSPGKRMDHDDPLRPVHRRML